MLTCKIQPSFISWRKQKIIWRKFVSTRGSLIDNTLKDLVIKDNSHSKITSICITHAPSVLWKEDRPLTLVKYPDFAWFVTYITTQPPKRNPQPRAPSLSKSPTSFGKLCANFMSLHMAWCVLLAGPCGQNGHFFVCLQNPCTTAHPMHSTFRKA